MKLNRDKIIHLSHLLVNALDDPEVVTWQTDKMTLRTEIANVMLEEVRIEEEVEQEVRQMLRSYKRQIIEGSSEWDVMYQKAFEEHLKKRGRIT